MTNGEKYKTSKDRADAFSDFCIWKTKGCNDCVFAKQHNENFNQCRFAWLELEAKEEIEEPLPCPYCGGVTNVRKNWNGTYQAVCEVKWCCYNSKCETTESETIAKHNRFAKLVLEQTIKEAKESEVAK